MPDLLAEATALLAEIDGPAPPPDPELALEMIRPEYDPLPPAPVDWRDGTELDPDAAAPAGALFEARGIDLAAEYAGLAADLGADCRLCKPSPTCRPGPRRATASCRGAKPSPRP